MLIKVADAPRGHTFLEGKVYSVYGRRGSEFVLDEDCEACFINDMEWEEVKSET